jgi:hypothetical protein
MPLSVIRTQPYTQILNSICVIQWLSRETSPWPHWCCCIHFFFWKCWCQDVSGEHIATEFIKGMRKKINTKMTAKLPGSHIWLSVSFLCHWSCVFLDIVWGTEDIYVHIYIYICTYIYVVCRHTWYFRGCSVTICTRKVMLLCKARDWVNFCIRHRRITGTKTDKGRET